MVLRNGVIIFIIRIIISITIYIIIDILAMLLAS